MASTDKAKGFLERNELAILICLVIFALLIRLYYFWFTLHQAVWWDEGEYLSTAKSWILGIPYDINPQRPPLFQFLAAIAFKIGLGEPFVKFAFVLIPSVLLVASIYFLGKEMFSRETGLIAALLASVSWTFLFWSARVQPDFFSMFFSVLAVYYMWRYWKKPQTHLAVISGVLIAISFYFKISGLLVPMIFFVFVLLKDRAQAFTNKDYYYCALAFIITLIPYFIWSYATFGTPTAFTSGYIEPVAKETPFGWYNLRFYYSLTEGLTFALFIIGLVFALRFILYADIMIKEKKRFFDPYIFCLVSFLVISAFYIFHIKNTDDRWVFLWLPFIFFIVAEAILLIYRILLPHNKSIAAISAVLLLLLCGYAQYSHADSLIKLKASSYAPVREAGIWIKDNSVPGDKVISISYTQTVYYTERNVTNYPLTNKNVTPEDLDYFILTNNPRYLEVSIFEPHPSWLFSYAQQGDMTGWIMDYTNSSIIIQNGQIVSLDIKSTVQRPNGVKLNLVYPPSQINGMFVYEIGY